MKVVLYNMGTNLNRSRTRKRAAKALAEGRVPGRPGTKKILVTVEMERAARCAITAKYRAANLEKVRAMDRARVVSRRDKMKAEKPLEYKLSYIALAATQRAKRGGKVSPKGLTAAVRRVWEKHDGHCAVCESVEKLELDHIIPLAAGGTNDEDNLQFLCEPCNRSKGAKEFHAWLASRAAQEGMAA